MKPDSWIKYILIIVFFICVILESTLIPAPLTLAVFMAILNLPRINKAAWAFSGGIMLDLFRAGLLGSTSLFLLMLAFMTDRYGKKFDNRQMVFQILTMIVSTIIYNHLFYKNISIVKILVPVVLGTLLTYLLLKIFPKEADRVELNL